MDFPAAVREPFGALERETARANAALPAQVAELRRRLDLDSSKLEAAVERRPRRGEATGGAAGHGHLKPRD